VFLVVFQCWSFERVIVAGIMLSYRRFHPWAMVDAVTTLDVDYGLMDGVGCGSVTDGTLKIPWNL